MRIVAIQGERGSNSHMAALAAARIAGEPAPRILPCTLSTDVFAALAAGAAHAAVLPIENSLHGSVAEHYDLLLDNPVHIVAETSLRIRHNLIAAPGAELSDLRRVLSHPVALSQCRRWLREHPELEVVPCYDTAGSVKMLMRDGLAGTAGIAPALAALEYGAGILIGGIEDHVDNFTRFYTLLPGDSHSNAEGADKLSIAFTLDHRPGALAAALARMSGAGLNLTRIESRPVPGRPWEYVFYIDLRFERETGVDRVLADLGANSRALKELGRYRAAGSPITSTAKDTRAD